MLNRREIAFSVRDIPELRNRNGPDDRVLQARTPRSPHVFAGRRLQIQGRVATRIPYTYPYRRLSGVHGDVRVQDNRSRRTASPPDPCKISDIEFTDAVAKNSLSALDKKMAHCNDRDLPGYVPMFFPCEPNDLPVMGLHTLLHFPGLVLDALARLG